MVIKGLQTQKDPSAIKTSYLFEQNKMKQSDSASIISRSIISKARGKRRGSTVSTVLRDGMKSAMATAGKSHQNPFFQKPGPDFKTMNLITSKYSKSKANYP